MNRTLIVARIRPGAQEHVAEIFAQSDATSLPHEIGVSTRSLYTLNDVYIHVVEMRQDAEQALRGARSLPAFRRISADLDPYIRPYDPASWRSPQDAIAHEFYSWTAE
ncbi:TcmI family type II polyketide cyclase [Nakamurella sp.]|uniref:TcmI family type II polyketide cyclase n=1 Tax=Nakamurella sp. TaxID=1869182 RepID=UPI0037847BE6